MPSTVSSRTQSPSLRQSPAAPSGVTVASGDSLSKLARRLGVSMEALVAANVARYPTLATNPGAIKVGWQLEVPGQGPASQAPTTPSAPSAGWAASAGRTQQAQQTGSAARPSDFGARLAAGGAQAIDLRMRQHLDSIEKTGVGVYYGDHSAMKNMSAQERADWAKQNAKPGATPPSTFKESSCIGSALENVGAAYAAAGKTERWNEILRTVAAKGSKGTDLAKELQKDGWQAIYWNPDAKNPNDGNAEHSFSAVQVKRGNGYYGVKVDDSILDYRPTDPSKTRQNLSGIEKLEQVPFFFGLAKGGMHTFVGRQGKVNEFHWDRMPNSTTAIDERPLKDWGWNSGL
ncbi:MAG: LysM peptidoglycan-binding domain-containing protein, partial [Myxococcaceae bacterium]|nr:LysM peptidoglycan-binding domain-containing protein [Myxococcaceae bacterium]